MVFLDYSVRNPITDFKVYSRFILQGEERNFHYYLSASLNCFPHSVSRCRRVELLIPILQKAEIDTYPQIVSSPWIRTLVCRQMLLVKHAKSSCVELFGELQVQSRILQSYHARILPPIVSSVSKRIMLSLSYNWANYWSISLVLSIKYLPLVVTTMSDNKHSI